jgi:hypothetical protein
MIEETEAGIKVRVPPVGLTLRVAVKLSGLSSPILNPVRT